jgi:hypothetical protein
LPRIIKFLIFFLLVGIIFEAGLLSSYTLVTSQPPNVGKIMGMQINDLTAVLNSIHKSTLKTYNVTNSELVAQALQNKTGLDGIDTSTLVAAVAGKSNTNINVTITATGYKDNQTTNNDTLNGNFTSGQIVIAPTATYNLTATATATLNTNGVELNVNTIQITDLKQSS